MKRLKDTDLSGWRKRLLFLLLLIPTFTFAQLCADEDTVRSNAASLITAYTARINGSVSHYSSPANVLSTQLRYVRVGQTDTATASASGTNPLRNLSGLQASTQYVYYYTSVCGSGTNRQLGTYTFTTLSASVVYATERSTVFPYIKSDTGWVVPRQDTALFRQSSTTGGNIVFNPTDSVFYGYNKARWVPLMSSTAGISNKVDSVTVSGDSLFYWINGTAYGYILPANSNDWQLTGNSGTSAGTNFLGTTDDQDIVFKRQSNPIGRLGSTSTSMGYLSLFSETLSGISSNTAYGALSLLNTTDGIHNIALGKDAGRNHVDGNYRLYINSIQRSNLGQDSTRSIIYGAQDATAANQRLYLNSQTFLPYTTAAANAADSMMVILPSTGKVGYRAIPTSSGGTVTGSGTTNTMTKWTSSTAIGDALPTDNGTTIGIISPATTTTGLDLSSSTLTSGALATFKSSSTAAAGNLQTGILDSVYGANATSGQTTYGSRFYNKHTGTSSTNVGALFEASGATTNKAIQTTGDVYINEIIAGYGKGAINTNTIFGKNTLVANSSGNNNLAMGVDVMSSLTSGASNAGIGNFSLNSNNGTYNTALGNYSLYSNTTAGYNVGVGAQSLFSNTNGENNVGIGYAAGRYISGGATANTKSDNSIFIGYGTMPLAASQTNQIVIGYNSTGLGSNTMVLGNSSITTSAIYGSVGIGTTSPTAAKLQVTGNGAASVSGGLWDGTWFSGGTATTTKPQLLIEPTGTTSTAWSTNGTGLGINAASGFTGRLIDGQVAGSSVFSVTNAGAINTQGTSIIGTAYLGSSASNTGSMYVSNGANRVGFNSSVYLAWDASTNPNTTGDVNISRNAAGILQVGTTAANALGTLSLAKTTIGGTSTTGNDLSITNSTLTTGSAASIAMTGTAATSNTKTGLTITSSGANATASQTVTGQTISVTNTGTSNTNVGLKVTASGATNNYAALFTGNVGIGVATPTSSLDVTVGANNIMSVGANPTNGVYLRYSTTDNYFAAYNSLANAKAAGSTGRTTYMEGNTGIQVGNASKFGFSSTTDAAGSADISLSRISANVLGVGTGAAGSTAGSLSLATLTAGTKINVTTGSNKSAGVSGAMTAGTITISTTAVTASSLIFLTHATLGGTQGALSVGTITAGTSFVINSSSALDTGTCNWWIIN